MPKAKAETKDTLFNVRVDARGNGWLALRISLPAVVETRSIVGADKMGELLTTLTAALAPFEVVRVKR